MERNTWMLDIDDGGLLDFINPFLRWYNFKNRTLFKKEDIYTYDFWKPLGVSEQEIVDEVNLFNESKYFRDLPEFPRATQFLKRLRESSDYLAITSRPSHTEEATRFNLQRRFNSLAPETIFAKPYTPLLGGNGYKSKKDLCLDRRIRFAVEDSSKQANELASVGIVVYLLSQPWNANEVNLHDNVIRVNSLEEISI